VLYVDIYNMTSGISTVEELQKVSQEHESNFVTDLTVDRIVKWFGVYFILALAVWTEVEDYFGKHLACFPKNNTESISKDFFELISLTCWEIPSTANYAEHCNQENAANFNQSDFTNLDTVKQIIKLLPMILLFQAFLISLPSVWWHIKFGSRLLAHLKLIAYLLSNICKEISGIKTVKFNEKPYDEKSEHLIGSLPFSNRDHTIIEVAFNQIIDTCEWLKNHFDNGSKKIQDLCIEIKNSIDKVAILDTTYKVN